MRSVHALATAFLLVGCNQFLAKNNPCGGIYYDDHVGQISSANVSTAGSVQTATAETFAFDSSLPPSVAQDCSWFVTGLVDGPDAGSETGTFYEVSCTPQSGVGSFTIVITLPDVRALDAQATVSVPAKLTLAQAGEAMNGGPSDQDCFPGSATLTIDTAIGGRVSGPPFVTSDFVRAGRVDFDGATPRSDAADGGADAAGNSGAPRECPSHATLHGRVTFTAKSYARAQDVSGDPKNCPDLPYK